MRPVDSIAAYQILIEAARSLNRVIDLDPLIDSILTKAREVMGAEACSILLPDHETGELIIHSAQGNAAPMLNAMRIPKGAGIAGQVYTTRETKNLADLEKNPLHYKGVDKKTGFITRAMLTIPMLNGEECLGVIQALNPIGRDNFDEQDESIFEVFATLIVSALLRLESQQRQMDSMREQQELKLAREIQSSFLPKDLQAHPGAEVRFHYSPAKEVGGDFCIVQPVSGQRLLVGLGDVSGKGIPAALTMARATAKIHATARYLGGDLGEWVTQLNTDLKEDLFAGRFIGVTFLLTELETEKVQVCCAGQFAPLVGTLEGWTEVGIPSQLPLGVLAGFKYSSKHFDLQRGQLWVIYSDGISEARNLKGQELSTNGLLAGLPKGQTLKTTLDHAVDTWKNFVGMAPAHDDASLVLMRWRGAKPAKNFDLQCCTSNLGEIRRHIESWAEYVGYEDIVTGHIILACDEAVTNIHRYAYHNQPGKIEFTIEMLDDDLVIRMRDYGTPSDPEKIVGRKLDEIRPGGLGSFLMQATFDAVSYEPHDQGTTLTLRKKLP